MKKNWIPFLLICGSVWFWMVYRQYQENKEFEVLVSQHKTAMAAWQAEQDASVAAREAARKAAADALALLQISADPTSGTVTTIAAAPEVRKLQQKLFSKLSAPRETVDLPLYRVEISTLGAQPTKWEIKSSRFVTNVRDDSSSATVQMIPQVGLDNEEREFPLGLVGNTARDFNDELFTVRREESTEGVKLIFEADSLGDLDLSCRKTYFFRKDSFVANLTVEFTNGPKTIKLLGGRQGYGIGWQGGFGDPEAADRVHGIVSVVYGLDGAVLTRQVQDEESKLEVTSKVDWFGQEKKYFTALLIPSAKNPVEAIRAGVDRRNEAPEYEAKGINPPIDTEILHEPVELAEGEKATLEYQMYVGPRHREAMSHPALALKEGATEPATVVFHTMPLGMSFLRPVALMLLGLMRFLHSAMGSWGLAIIGTTICVRILIYPLTHWAIKSQAKTMIEQQRIRPEMDEINKKFKSDPMKRNQAIMQLYRDHNVNPLGMLRGCFPILLQAPIFMALYVLFEQSVELRGQSFLWIRDLSGPDALAKWGTSLWVIGNSFNLLPILMGITNYIQMSIMQMPSTDETQAAIQKQMQLMMPIMFTFFLYQLPAGLVLYWIVSNTISIGQSVLTKRIIASHMAAHEASKTAQ